MPDHTRQEKPGLWAAFLLGAFTVIAPQLLGGATPSTQLWITIGGAAVALACAFACRGTDVPLGVVPLAALAAVCAAGWTFIQALPIPCALSAWAQPERSALAKSLFELGAVESERCSLSLSPGGTWAALSLAAVILALILSATAVCRAGHRQPLLLAIAGSSIAMACVALAHAVMDASSVFGVYTPRYAKPQFLLAPLMNENHLAGHIALGFPLCLAFARTSERLEGKTFWWTAAFVTFATGLLTLSRGGAGALVLGGLAYLLVEFRSRRSRKSTRTRLAAVAGAMLCMALGTWFSVDLLAKQFTEDGAPLRKLKLALQLSDLIWTHPWVGIGRGALGDVSGRLILRNQRVLFAENVGVQWLLEWGIPAALLIAALFCASFSRLRLEQRAEKALACGFFALLAQNLVDFSLELAGVACVAAVALGVLVAREGVAAKTAWFQDRVRLRATLGVAAAASALCAALAAPWLTWSSRPRLAQQLSERIAGSAPAAEVKPLLARGFEGYPLDPVFLVMGTALAVREDEPRTPHWLNLAFEAAPGWAGPHLQAAAYLERRGRLGQAAIELGIAVDLDPSSHAAPCAFVKRHPIPELVWAVVPPDAANEQSRREAVVDCLIQDHHWAQADQALAPLLERFPKSEYALRRSVLAAGNLGQPELARERAWAMFRTLPNSPLAILTLTSVLSAQGQAAAALPIIDRLPRSLRETQDVLWAEATAAARIPDERRLERALERLLARYGTAAQARAGLLRFAAEQLTIAGNHHAALSRAQSAYDMSGDPGALELAHQAALRAGMLSAALRTAAQLCNVGHRGKTFCGQGRSFGGMPP